MKTKRVEAERIARKVMRQLNQCKYESDNTYATTAAAKVYIATVAELRVICEAVLKEGKK